MRVWEIVDTGMRAIAGEWEWDGGTGFGARDMGWYFEHREQAYALKERFERSSLPLEGIKILCWPSAEEDPQVEYEWRAS
jgi:hypothetical protein